MNSTFFSIIIPLYNKEAHIVATLNSVFAQTFSNYEIVIVNDGSTDNGFEVVSEIKDNRIQLFNTKNQGVSAARNFAMQHAKGDYYAFLDADDVWLPNHLSELNKLTTHYPDCGMYCSNYEFDYGNFKTHPKFPTLPKGKNWSGIVEDYFLASMVNRINTTPSTAIPKSIITDIGMFDTHFTSGQDTDYWTRIALKYPVAFTKKQTVSIKVYANNRISDTNPSKRKFMNLDNFLDEEKTNISLKKYNDMYRAELALKHRTVGDYKTCNLYLKNMDYNNINTTSKVLLQLPSFILKPLWILKQWLKTKKIDFYIR